MISCLCLQLDRELSANGASDSHSHNDDVSSVSIVLDGNVDPEKVNTFLEETLLESEENIYRYKGIMSIDGHDTRSIIQVCSLSRLDVICYKGIMSDEGHDTRSTFQLCT